MSNESLARRWFDEVWNQRRIETIQELVSDDGVCHSEGGPVHGINGFIENAYKPFVATFPDLKVQVVGIVSQGDEVAVRWTAEGTHTGDAMGVSATNRRVRFRGMTWIRYREGKMVEGWDCWNMAALVGVLKDGTASASVEQL